MASRSPALPLAVAFAAGTLIHSGSSAPGPKALPLAALGLALGAVLLWRGRLGASTLAVVVAFGCLGVAARDLRARSSETPAPRLRELHERLGAKAFIGPSRVTARLRHEASFGRDTTVLTLDVEALRHRGGTFPIRGGLRAMVGGELQRLLEPLRAGDRVEVWGRLRLPRAFGNPNSFDVDGYLDRAELDLDLSVKSARLVELVSRARTSPLRRAISGLRASARLRLAQAFGPHLVTRGIVLALVTGERSELDPEVERLYQRAGIFHVMAISGAHVAVLALLVHGALRRCGVDEVPSLVLLLFALPLYAALCGARPPVTRAVVMAALVVGARLSSLDRSRLNALSLGALALLVWRPLSLSDPGFQLSFAAMTAIVLLGEPLTRRLSFLGFLAAPAAVSVAAQLGVVPLAAWHFHRLAPWAPAASLVAMPLASLLVVLGLVIAFTPALPCVTLSFVTLARGVALLMTETASLTQALPGASVAVARPSPLTCALYLAAVAALVTLGSGSLRPRARRCASAVALLCVAAAAIPTLRGHPARDGNLTLTAIDVGHGDALLLRLPDGRAVLVDGGGAPGSSFDVGERVVVPFLLDAGFRKLDAVVLTHADFDHVGGLFAVLDDVTVGTVWEGAPRWDRAVYRSFRRRARERGVPVRRLEPDESFALGGARFDVLSAGGRDVAGENDRSLVLRVSFAGRSILFTGDAERALEEELLRRGAALSADVLKVGHHGSRSSTTAAFLHAVDPAIAIISARARPGPGWPIPSTRVLHRLKSKGVEYLRTDTEGAITVTLDARGGMEVTTHRGR